MAGEFVMFLPHTKDFNILATYCSRAYSTCDSLKTIGGGHAVHERQGILSTTVVISHTFCMAKENELTPRGAWQ